jgi:hypothetical protein
MSKAWSQRTSISLRVTRPAIPGSKSTEALPPRLASEKGERRADDLRRQHFRKARRLLDPRRREHALHEPFQPLALLRDEAPVLPRMAAAVGPGLGEQADGGEGAAQLVGHPGQEGPLAGGTQAQLSRVVRGDGKGQSLDAWNDGHAVGVRGVARGDGARSTLGARPAQQGDQVHFVADRSLSATSGAASSLEGRTPAAPSARRATTASGRPLAVTAVDWSSAVSSLRERRA